MENNSCSSLVLQLHFHIKKEKTAAVTGRTDPSQPTEDAAHTTDIIKENTLQMSPSSVIPLCSQLHLHLAYKCCVQGKRRCLAAVVVAALHLTEENCGSSENTA